MKWCLDHKNIDGNGFLVVFTPRNKLEVIAYVNIQAVTGRDPRYTLSICHPTLKPLAARRPSLLKRSMVSGVVIFFGINRWTYYMMSYL